MKPPIALTPEQYLKLLVCKRPLSPDAWIVVATDVTLPKGTKALPACRTVFAGRLDARGSSLVSFDAEVKGYADFKGVATLREIGPKAKFGGPLDARGTSLERFDAEVKGHADFEGVATLREIGTKAKFGGPLNASGTALRRFDSEVEGNAFFTHAVRLREFGPNARFGSNLYVRGTTLTSVTCPVRGKVEGIQDIDEEAKQPIDLPDEIFAGPEV